MKGPKRLLSVLLAASLSVWCVPAGALAEEAPGASDGAAVSGTPSADATIGSSSAADGAGTDAETSQVKHLRSLMPLLALLLLRPRPRNLPPQARVGLQEKRKPQVMNPSRACT